MEQTISESSHRADLRGAGLGRAPTAGGSRNTPADALGLSLDFLTGLATSASAVAISVLGHWQANMAAGLAEGLAEAAKERAEIVRTMAATERAEIAKSQARSLYATASTVVVAAVSIRIARLAGPGA